MYKYCNTLQSKMERKQQHHHAQSSRSNIKSNSTNTLRESMNRRRHDLSSKIRKTRRTHQIQLKRRCLQQQSQSQPHNATSTSSSQPTSSMGINITDGDNNNDNPKMSVVGVLPPLPEAIDLFLINPNQKTIKELQQSMTSNINTTTSSIEENGTSNSTNSTTDIMTKLLRYDNPQKGEQLLSVCHQILQSSSTEHHHQQQQQQQQFDDSSSLDQLKLQVLRILTNLAATTTTNASTTTTTAPQQNEEDYNYYGPSSKVQQSWCELIIYNMLQSSLIPCFQSLQNYTSDNDDSRNDVKLQIVSQTSWVIGNLAGDDTTLTTTTNGTTSTSSSRTFMISQTNVILELIQVFKKTIGLYTSSLKSSTSSSSSSTTTTNLLTEIIRNTLWALSNLARGNTTSALLFLTNDRSISSTTTSTTAPSLLTCTDIITILEISQLMTNDDPSIEKLNKDQISWLEVQVELYWLLAFLTAREDDAIGCLLLSSSSSSSSNNNHVKFLQLIICHFAHCTEQILTYFVQNQGSSSSTTSTSTNNDKDYENNYSILIRMIIPILRIIGNISCSQSGTYIPLILTLTHPTKQTESIATILSKWMLIIEYQPSHDIMSISTEATWVCRSLLCDVGYDQHPSTTIACPILIPALCTVLISKNGNPTIDWKREVLSALWNALSPPPNSIAMGKNNDMMIMEHQEGNNKTMTNFGNDMIQIRDKLLQSLCETNGLIKVFVDMVQSASDVDAMSIALKIIDVIHRRVVERYDASGTIKRVLHEADCLNVLEGVCDNASANIQYGNARDWNNDIIDDCAEIAANLIDDYYDDDDGIGESGVSMGGSNNGFAFHVDSTNQTTFDFSEMSNQNGPMINMAPQRELSPVSSMSAEGMGRGRGRITPAWMCKK